MTDGPTGRMTPPDPDPERVFPASIEGVLGEESLRSLSEKDWEGVPIPYGFRFAGETVTEWARRIEDEGVTPDLMADIAAGFGERETRYPGAPMWDRCRGLLAGQLFDRGYLQHSLDLVYGMHSNHRMAATLMDLAHREEGRDADLIFSSLLRRFQVESESKDRLLGLVQALIDRLIQDEPHDPIIDSFETILSGENPNYDPVQAWADSQRELNPQVNWDGIVAFVRNDAMWEGVPTRYRQYAMLANFEMLKTITEPDTEMITDMVESIARAQEAYPDARMWDEFRIALASQLVEQGYPTFALDFGRALRDGRYQQGLVVALLEAGAEDAGLELTEVMANTALMVETLIEADWTDNTGAKRLSAIVTDDTYPMERRIACVEAIRDRVIAQDQAEAAAKYDEYIRELREQAQK